ncbi:MAG: peptide chain release factor N(5)-glutamine methyltransferase [Candidatus Latescibacteria bacterium]|nr:peptide chain release factor N(5)-glutamine methyltransferase [Candidatus Latescibacterota bacterium]
MENNPLFRELFDYIATANISTPDFPDETTEATLKALWNTAAGTPCSAQKALSTTLPEMTPECKKALELLIDKRISGAPLAQLTGRVQFMGLELFIEPEVLIPRPETELLGYTVTQALSDRHAASERITGIDVGCGSGNLSCGIAMHHPGIHLYAIDITDTCVACTAKNAAQCDLTGRITVLKGDLFSPLVNMHLESSVDVVISNPPYIPSVKLQSSLSHLVRHEPCEAFNGGTYGFSLHQRLIKESLPFLKSGGSLFFEFGIRQENQVQALFSRIRGYKPIRFKNDNEGNPRVVIATKI